MADTSDQCLWTQLSAQIYVGGLSSLFQAPTQAVTKFPCVARTALV